MKRVLTIAMFALAGCGSADESTTTTATPADAGVNTPEETVTPACAQGLTWCGASCEDLRTSQGSCGVCNLHCPLVMTCVNGVCTDR